MRKYYFLAFFLAFLPGKDIFSQNDIEILHNKVSINLFSYVNRPVVKQNNGCYPVIMHGLMYTRDLFSNRYVRIRFDYFQRNIDNSYSDIHDVNLYSDIQMGSGFVKAFGDGRVKPYVAGDFLFTSTLKYVEEGGSITGVYEKIQVRRTGTSMYPVLGITVQVNGVLSFSAETNVEFGYAYEKGTDFTWSADTVALEKQIKNNLFFARWNPIGLLSVELSF